MAIMNNNLANQITEIQTTMIESAKSCFDDSELGHLRAVIRLTMEFHHYLEYGSVDMASGLRAGPTASYFADLETASKNPFNKYDMNSTCKSIRSGVDSFCALNASYRLLVGATSSHVRWGAVSSWDSFRLEFDSMFARFTKEVNFEDKCRLLLDLFKLQIIFAGISYD